MLKGVEVHFAYFISYFLNIPSKRLRPNYFIFIRYLKTQGGKGDLSIQPEPLWTRHWYIYDTV